MPYSKLANRIAIRSSLEAFGLEAKYDLGQNFLIDDTVVGRICELADLRPDDVVLEVGPGLGTLTCALLPRVAAVVAVEADEDMQGPLGENTADYSERLALVLGDATKVAPARLEEALAELSARSASMEGLPTLPSRWVANLPYAVAATLILKFFQEWPFIQDATVMVQSEVADRICADPDNKIYGAYTAKLALFARPTGRLQVPPQSFFPAPHVESAVVHLERRTIPGLLDDEIPFVCEVIDAAFAQRRKTIRNSMAASETWSKSQLDGAFAAVGIDGACRAETLDEMQFIELARALKSGVAGVDEAKPAQRKAKPAKRRAEFDPDLI